MIIQIKNLNYYKRTLREFDENKVLILSSSPKIGEVAAERRRSMMHPDRKSFCSINAPGPFLSLPLLRPIGHLPPGGGGVGELLAR